MNRLRSYLPIVLTALLLVLGQALILPPPASASFGTADSAVYAPFELPAGAVLLFITHAKGTQNYACVNGQWQFHAPQARLFDPETHRRIGVHYGGIDRGLTPGPWWESVRDGSRIRAGNPVIEPSQQPDSIPLLQLEVLEWEGSGLFSEVETIQRLNTVGGVGPTGPCHGGQQRRVPYTADYYFYGTAIIELP